MRRNQLIVIIGAAAVGVGILFAILRMQPAVTDDKLLEMIRRSDLAAVQAYLNDGGAPDRKIDVYGRPMSLLQAAVFDREEDIALALVQAGAELQASGVTLQDVGVNGLDRLLTEVLPSMAFGGDGPLRDTGIVNAAGNGYYDTVGVYVARAAGGEGWATELNRAIGIALAAGYDDVARFLLENGASLDEMLHVAARFSSPGMVRYLLSRGLDPNEALALPPDAEPPERRPIEFAWKRYLEEMDYYDSLPADSYVSSYRSDDVAYVLYELARAGATFDIDGFSEVARDGIAELSSLRGRERLLLAARAGFYNTVDQVLSSDSFSAADLRDALLVALRTDHDDIARRLLLAGAPANGGSLHVAASASSPGLVRYLLSNGADIDELYEGRSPLQFWLEQNVTEDAALILHELIVAGADACWLVDRQDELPGASVDMLTHSTPACFD